MDEKKVLDETQEDEVVAREDEEEVEAEDEGAEVEAETDEEEETEESGEEVEDEEGESEEEAEKEVVVEKEAEEEEVVRSKQNAEENARYAAARREAEAKQKKAEENLRLVLNKAGFATIGELLQSEVKITDEKREEIRKHADEVGINADVAVEEAEDKAYLRNLRAKETAREQQAAAQKASEERARLDIEAFKAEYPTIEINKLFVDKRFELFSKGKIGQQTLVEVYRDYRELVGSTATEAVKKAQSKEERTTGTASSGNQIILTRTQQRQLEAWNSMYPNMAMTEAEFLKK